MPNLAAFHPVLVHFAIGFLVAGVLLRWISLTGRAPFTSPAATTLLLAGTLAAVLSVSSGDDAHGPVERVPGSADAVHEHEVWGERARNAFFFVAAAELALLALARRGRERQATIASAVLCVPALFCLYEAGEHGGELVYSYAGGVGIRTGDPADVDRLFIAAAHHQIAADRKAGRPADAAIVATELGRRHPRSVAVQLTVAESLLLDRKDAAATMALLGGLQVPSEDRRSRIRHGFLMADAQEAAGQRDAARATLQQLLAAFPDNRRIQQRLAGGAPPQ